MTATDHTACRNTHPPFTIASTATWGIQIIPELLFSGQWPSPPAVHHRRHGAADLVAVDLPAGKVFVRWHACGTVEVVDDPDLLDRLAAHQARHGWTLPAGTTAAFARETA